MKNYVGKISNRLVAALFVGLLVYTGLYIARLPLFKGTTGLAYPFALPELPYKHNALEPHIDALTMEIHHKKHHQAYVDNLNAALKDHPELHKKTVVELLTQLDALPESIRTAVRNNGGGHYNHSFFWTIMGPKSGGEPKGELKEAINKYFKDFATFKEQFSTAAKKVFGSGWAWLVMDKQGNLQVISTANQDSPISQGLEPLLGLDVWEHAYYLKYQNKRPDYIEAWWHVVNWPKVEEYFKKAHASHSPPK